MSKYYFRNLFVKSNSRGHCIKEKLYQRKFELIRLISWAAIQPLVQACWKL